MDGLHRWICWGAQITNLFFERVTAADGNSASYEVRCTASRFFPCSFSVYARIGTVCIAGSQQRISKTVLRFSAKGLNEMQELKSAAARADTTPNTRSQHVEGIMNAASNFKFHRLSHGLRARCSQVCATVASLEHHQIMGPRDTTGGCHAKNTTIGVGRIDDKWTAF